MPSSRKIRREEIREARKPPSKMPALVNRLWKPKTMDSIPSDHWGNSSSRGLRITDQMNRVPSSRLATMPSAAIAASLPFPTRSSAIVTHSFHGLAPSLFLSPEFDLTGGEKFEITFTCCGPAWATTDRRPLFLDIKIISQKELAGKQLFLRADNLCGVEGRC